MPPSHLGVQIVLISCSCWEQNWLYKGMFTPSVSNTSAIVAVTSLRIQCNSPALFCYTKHQLYDNAPEWGCNPFSSVSIDFNENRIASIITELIVMLGVNGPQQLFT